MVSFDASVVGDTVVVEFRSEVVEFRSEVVEFRSEVVEFVEFVLTIRIERIKPIIFIVLCN